MRQQTISRALRAHRRIRNSTMPVVHALEARTLFAAGASYDAANDVVNVQGSNGNDTITVWTEYVSGEAKLKVQIKTPGSTINKSFNITKTTGLPYDPTNPGGGTEFIVDQVKVLGGDGNDTIDVDASTVVCNVNANRGNDTIHGGDFYDTLIGGSGDDTIYSKLLDTSNVYASGNQIYGDMPDGSGTPGNDWLYGSNSPDAIDGGAGNDTIVGNNGDDSIKGGNGDDRVAAGNGKDTVHGGYGRDRIYGEKDNDALNGDHGGDTIYGGDGMDAIDGGADIDLLYGDKGNDVIQGGDHNDEIHGGDDNDTLYAHTLGSPLGGSANHHTLYGDAGNDTLYGTNATEAFYGGSGNDKVYARGGHDYIYAGTGVDSVWGGSGNDLLHNSDTTTPSDGVADFLKGEEGNDSFLVRLSNLTELTNTDFKNGDYLFGV